MNKLLLEMSEQHLHEKSSAGKQQASDFIACINETTRVKKGRCLRSASEMLQSNVTAQKFLPVCSIT